MRICNFSLVLVLLLLLFAGCALPVKFNPANRQEIKSIGLLTIQEPPGRYFCNDISFRSRQIPGMQFGVIGGLLGPSINDMVGTDKPANKLTILEEAFDKENFDARLEIYNSLKAQLTKTGYNVTYIDIQREEGYPVFIKDYSKVRGTADAYLDVLINRVGCYDSFMFGEKPGMYYRPWLSLRIRLVRAKDGKVLYAVYPLCGISDSDNFQHTKFKLDKTYTWDSFEELINDSPHFVKGIREAISKITTKVGEDLK